MNMDTCKLCNQPIECYVRKYATRPFIDNKYYDYICHACASVPSSFEYDSVNDLVVTYLNLSPFHLNQRNDMVDMGWTKIEADASIKAVTKRVNHITCVLQNTYILNAIILGPSVLIVQDGSEYKLIY